MVGRWQRYLCSLLYIVHNRCILQVMIFRVLWMKMRRRKLMIIFLTLVGFATWVLYDYDVNWLSQSCWTKSCKRLREQQGSENAQEDDDFDDLLPERLENLLLIPNPVKNLQNISNASICTLPNVDPFEESVSHLISEFGPDPDCHGPDIPFAINSRSNLVIRKKEYRSTLKLRSTKLSYIIRPKDSDDSYYVGPELLPFKKAANKKIRKMTQDFVKLTYEPKDDEEIVHFMAKVAAKKDVLQRSQRYLYSNPAGLPLNILMFGFDSTSHAMFLRKLPRTSNYLKKNLDAYLFKGYSVVGDGTTPILTALLTGKFVSELIDKKERNKNSDEDLNKWPWIMKEYAKHGYATLYAEDDQKIAAFNIRMSGFRMAPADHYMRPFWLALEDHILRKMKRKKKFPNNNLACLGSETLHNITLDYLFSMFDAYPRTPKFGFAFMSYLSHGVPDKISYADNDVVRYLKRYEKMRNNTVLIILSDHGARIGKLRNSMQGSLEERLPWLSIVLPKWFSKRYPEFAANMRDNQHVVTSPFDIHATLRHFLTFPNIQKGQKTQSLLTKISNLRSCANAGIDYHWCPCLKWKPTSVDLPAVKKGAQVVVQRINDIIAKSEYSMSRCAPLVLTKVVYAAELETSNTGSEYLLSPVKNGHMRRRKVPAGKRLQIVLETSPLKGNFEATLTVRSNGHVVVNPHISRTSVYSNNPHCIVDRHPELRKFCVCYDKIEKSNDS